MMNGDENEEAVYDLISLFEIGGSASSVDAMLPHELAAMIPRFKGVVTAERLGGIIDESISALTDPAARAKARGRWRAVKVAMLSDGDQAIRSAAAASITDDDLDDPVVVARFRDEVEHGDPEVVLCFAEAFAENVSHTRRDDLATVLIEFAETLSSAPELTIVLQVLGTLYTRARTAVPRDVLTRLASVAARSLIWEPEPATLCAWSIETHGQYDMLAEWLQSPDADMASFATWIASKLAGKLNPADRALVRDALRQMVVRLRGSAENPRAVIAAQRGEELLALIDGLR